MKRHHLFQQSLSGTVLHLRKDFVLLCLFLGCISVKASNKPILPTQIDAVYVFCMDFDVHIVVNVSKEDFLSNKVRNGEVSSVVVNDPKKIEQLIHFVNSLRESADLNNKDATSFYYKPIISKSDCLHLVNTYPLDIRGLIIIESSMYTPMKKNTYTPIWMSNNYVEIGNTYYEISEDMREWVRDISNQ